MSGGNVLPQLPLFDPPRQKAFRDAVARVIRSNVELAEEIGCCADTIGNAENENNDLSAVILLRIAYRFGEAAIAPVRALYQREVTPAPTIDERLERIEREVAEIRKVAV